jgi:hypothetical protein
MDEDRRDFLQDSTRLGAFALTSAALWRIDPALAQSGLGRELATLSIDELSHHLANLKITSRQLVEQALAAIKDPQGEGSRTFLRIHESEALAAADQVDARRRGGACQSASSERKKSRSRVIEVWSGKQLIRLPRASFMPSSKNLKLICEENAISVSAVASVRRARSVNRRAALATPSPCWPLARILESTIEMCRANLPRSSLRCRRPWRIQTGCRLKGLCAR